MTEKPPGLALVGLGTAGALMLEAVLSHSGVRLVVAVDTEPEVRQALAECDITSTTDLDSVLADDDVHIVYFATPTPLHAVQASAALSAGKDVIVEKPVATSVEAALDLGAAASREGRALVVGHSMSFDPFIRAARSAIHDYRLGAVRAIQMVEETDWMRRPRLPDELDESCGGGPVMRQGAHLVDVARYLCDGGRADGITARGFSGADTSCAGAFVSTFQLDGVADVSLAYSGFEPPIEPVTDDSGLDIEELTARKRRVAGARLHRVLAQRRNPVPQRVPSRTVNRRRILVLCDRGQLSIHGEEVHANDGRNTFLVEDSQLSGGRTAVIDEMLEARSSGVALHDAAWAAENLRICLEISAAIDKSNLLTAAPRA